MSKVFKCFNLVRAKGTAPLKRLLLRFKYVNLLQFDIEVGIRPWMRFLAKLTTRRCRSLQRVSASIIPLRFIFSSLIPTMLVACRLHFIPFKLYEQGCGRFPFQPILRTFCESTALINLKNDSDSDNSPPTQPENKGGSIAMHISPSRNRNSLEPLMLHNLVTIFRSLLLFHPIGTERIFGQFCFC